MDKDLKKISIAMIIVLIFLVFLFTSIYLGFKYLESKGEFQNPEEVVNDYVSGGNMNVGSRMKDLDKKYLSLTDAMIHTIEDFNSEDIFYTFEVENVTIIFFKNDGAISSFEYVENDGFYYYFGTRGCIFYNEEFLCDDEYRAKYSVIETIMGDIYINNDFMYNKYIKELNYKVHPLWGVLKKDEANSFIVENIEVSKIIDFTYNETDYYLWIIDDFYIDKKTKELEIIIK